MSQTQTRRSSQVDLLHGSILKSLLLFALPIMASRVFQQIYNTMDTLIVGYTLGDSSIAAMGACSSIYEMMTGFTFGVGNGLAIVTARCFGRQETDRMKKSVASCIVIGVAVTLVVTILATIFMHPLLRLLKTPAKILEESYSYISILSIFLFVMFAYNLCSGLLRAIGNSFMPLVFLIFSSLVNIVLDLLFIRTFGMGVRGAAIATVIAQGISAVLSLLIFLCRMRRYESRFDWFDRQELHSMLQIAVPSVLQQSTVSIGMMIVQAVVNPFGTQALAGYSATMRVENVFSLIFVSIGNAVSPYVSQNLGAKKIERIKKGYHAALVLDICFAVLAFIIIESLHTQISSLFLGKDGTALAYQVSGNYMRWLGYFFTFMGIKMATDGVLRGLGIMRPFLVANMVNLAIRLSVALIFAPRFGIAFVWLAVPAGWFANFLISYGALRKSWPSDNCNCVINTNELL